MNARERLLAIGVGALLALFVLYYGWSTVGGWIRARQQRVDALEDQLAEENFQKRLGERNLLTMESLQSRSLPGDADVARSLYQQMLLELATEVKLSDIDVSALPGGQRAKGYQELGFKLKGRGDLRQVTQLLFAFYRADRLERVRYLSLKPVRDSKLLDLDLTLEALVLNDAPRVNQLPQVVDQQMADVGVEKYLGTIVGRNLFARENQPPKLAAARATTYPGETVRLELKASDSDELDKLMYQLAGAAPEGATLDRESGAFRWQPKQKGDYVFKVIVTDDGLPAKSSEAEIRVAVADRPPRQAPPERGPPPPKSPDVNVLNTFVTGITGSAENPLVWFSVRTTGETIKVHSGEKFEVGNYTGVVKHVGNNTVEVHAEGRQFLMALGESFEQAIELPAEGL